MVRPLAALAAWWLAASVGAHPLHTTFTEVVEDPASHTVTVTVRSFSDDLARAIGAPARSANTPSAALPDSALARYVRSRISLTDKSGHSIALRYAGQRQSADLSWLSFTTMTPTSLSGASLSNRLQVELYPDQVNLVQARYGGRSETLLFSGDQGARTFP
ncbi:MAG: DUF6702 family protein [Gemmatimonadota bacterium]